MKRISILNVPALIVFILFFVTAGYSQNAWINEIHYDNSGTDVGEMIEVVVENASSYSISGFHLYLYNGNDGSHYGLDSLSNFTIGNTIGNFTIFYKMYPANGIQNGAPDGMALAYQGTLITGQWLSYEGTMIATTGPAAGQTSVDIVVFESSATPIGQSLQLGGSGSQYSQFTWQQPMTNTAGLINTNQSFGGVTPDPEPSNYPTAFTATVSGLSVELNWTDATGSQLPSAYVIIASTTPIITAPVDTVPTADDLDLSDGIGAKNVFFSLETYTFSGLDGNTTYYFEIYPYTNSGNTINYKNDNVAPAAYATTSIIVDSISFNNNTFGSWDTISLASDKNWFVDNYGSDFYAEVNGYQSNVPCDDWLISPPLYLDNYTGEVLTFRTASNYIGPDLEVMASTNYSGGNPGLATWTDLNPTLSGGSWAWTASGTIDLSSYSGTVYLAFRYTSTTTGATLWRLDDIVITGVPLPTGIPVINELIADNELAYIDPSDNEYDDWIELFNPTTADISLNNWYMTDDIQDTTKWQFPDTTIQNNAYLIVWADEDILDPGLHADFKISKSGEAVYLFDDNKVLMDSVVFGQQYEDTTWGRIPNAFGPFVFTKPTPMAYNQLFPIIIIDTVPPIVLNAVGTDYTEVKVTFSEAVDSTAEIISNYSGVGTISSAVLSPTLDAVTLTLATPMVAGNTYNLNISGVHDTSGNVMVAAQVFPVAYGPSNADIVITEIMYNPPESGTDSLEYIELYNNGSNAVIMTGFYFSDGIDYTFPAYTLDAGAFVVVAKNAGAMMNALGVTALQWTGSGLSNSGETIEFKDNFGQELDKVDYLDAAPWPSQPDGFGPSLTLCDPSSDNQDPANWAHSIEFIATNGAGDSIYGTPGSICMGSGINDHIQTLRGVSIYPNPNNGILHIDIDREGSFEVVIYNITGAEEFTAIMDRNNNIINMPSNIKGMKLIKITDNASGASFTDKLYIY